MATSSDVDLLVHGDHFSLLSSIEGRRNRQRDVREAKPRACPQFRAESVLICLNFDHLTNIGGSEQYWSALIPKYRFGCRARHFLPPFHRITCRKLTHVILPSGGFLIRPTRLRFAVLTSTLRMVTLPNSENPASFSKGGEKLTQTSLCVSLITYHSTLSALPTLKGEWSNGCRYSPPVLTCRTMTPACKASGARHGMIIGWSEVTSPLSKLSACGDSLTSSSSSAPILGGCTPRHFCPSNGASSHAPDIGESE